MKTMRKFVVFLTVLALTVSCFAMTAAATAEEEIIPAETAPVETVPEPEPTEPESTEMPEATEPEATEPEATEPEATEPEATEPETTEPEVTEPEETEPESTEEIVIEPELNGDSPAVSSGVCGDNLTWTLDGNGLLTVSGTGAMTNYTAESPAPWAGQTVNYIVVSDGVTVIGDYAFYQCGAEEITLPTTLRTIGKYALAKNDMQLLIIPKGVTAIGDYAVSDSDALDEVVLPNTLKTIGEYAFARCYFTYVEIPNSVTSMGVGAFYSCPYLAELYISGGLTSVAERAFQYCANLEYIIVPASVTYFGPYAFSDCTSISQAYYLGTEDQFYEISFAAGNRYLENADWYLATIAIEQPEDVTTSEGMTVSFSVKASRPNCTYQWYTMEDGTDYWEKCTGASATKPTYTFTAYGYMTGYFCCLITDEFGSEFTSKTAVLLVYDAPRFTTQPKNGQAKKGETVSTSVAAFGEGLSYAWYFTSNADDNTFSKSSVTGDTYTCEMSEDRNGRKVYCVITDKFGNSTKSDVAVLTMEKTPLAIVSQPQSITVKPDTTARVSVQAEGDGLTYTWYFAAKGSSKFSKSSITTASYSTTMDITRDGRRVYCVITDKYGKSVTTDTVTLSMEKTPLTITQQPQSVTVVSGAAAKTTVKAEGVGLTYTWYFTSGGSSTKFSKSSITSATYSTTMNADRNGRQVYCIVTDAYGQTEQTATATLSMKDAVKIVAQPQTVKVGSGETAKTCVEAEGEGLTYTWYYANKGKTSFTKSSYKTNTYSTIMDATRDGRRVYCVITDKYGNSVKTNTVTLYMYTPLALVQQPKDVLVAEGTTARTTVKVNGDGLTYTWYFTSGGSSTAFSKSSIKTATYSTTMDASRDGRKVYCVITDRYGDSVTTNTVTLSMKPVTRLAITQQPKDMLSLPGRTAWASVVAEGDGLTYTWYFTNNAADKTFSKSSITGDTYSCEMTADRNGRRVYCVITDAYGNSVKTKTVTLTRAKLVVYINHQPEDVEVPNGAKATTSVAATGDGLTYTWYFTSNAADTTFSKSSVTTSFYSTTMDASRDGRRVYCVVTDQYGNSEQTRIAVLTMTGSSSPTTKLEIINHPDSVTVAEGETATATVLAQGDGLTYTWYYTPNGTTDKFYKSSVTSATYSTVMDASRDGRQVYCVVTDAYGNTAVTYTVTLRMNVIGEVRTVNTDNLTIRSTPSRSGNVVGYLNTGDVVTVTETKTADGYTWGKISNGWIALEYTV